FWVFMCYNERRLEKRLFHRQNGVLRGSWRGGRAVECTGLENRKAERPREFESHPLRSLDFERLTLATLQCIKNLHKRNDRAWERFSAHLATNGKAGEVADFRETRIESFPDNGKGRRRA